MLYAYAKLSKNSVEIIIEELTLILNRLDSTPCRELSRSAGRSSRRMIFSQNMVRSVKIEDLPPYHNIN